MSQAGAGPRGHGWYPFLGARVALPLQLALSEPLIWRMRDMAARLLSAAAASEQAAGGAAAAAGQPDPQQRQHQAAAQQHQAAAADVAVRIRLLSLADLATEVSFQGDPLSRPRRARLNEGGGAPPTPRGRSSRGRGRLRCPSPCILSFDPPPFLSFFFLPCPPPGT